MRRRNRESAKDAKVDAKQTRDGGFTGGAPVLRVVRHSR